jgi:hypothetical protein
MIAVSSCCRRRVPTIDSTPIPLPCARSTRRRSLKLAGKWKGRRLSLAKPLFYAYAYAYAYARTSRTGL